MPGSLIVLPLYTFSSGALYGRPLSAEHGDADKYRRVDIAGTPDDRRPIQEGRTAPSTLSQTTSHAQLLQCSPPQRIPSSQPLKNMSTNLKTMGMVSASTLRVRVSVLHSDPFVVPLITICTADRAICACGTGLPGHSDNDIQSLEIRYNQVGRLRGSSPVKARLSEGAGRSCSHLPLSLPLRVGYAVAGVTYGEFPSLVEIIARVSVC